jgi:hypothetical protein
VQLTVVNNLYAQQEGITFYRDDGQPIPILDWAESGRTTTSPNNVIATISGNFLGVVASQYVLHLNAAFSGPTFELGAFFGNDQPWGWDYTTTTLSVFGADANFLGSVSVDTNSNTSVDQFIGLRSDVAFHSARFENNGSTFAVVLDDISFGSEPLPEVPEPATIGLLGMGIAGLAARMRRKKSA